MDLVPSHRSSFAKGFLWALHLLNAQILLMPMLHPSDSSTTIGAIRHHSSWISHPLPDLSDAIRTFIRAPSLVYVTSLHTEGKAFSHV
jgi:hypothetical protein